MGRRNRAYKARMKTLAITRQKKETNRLAGVFLQEIGMTAQS
jgi:hypothetical protein